MSEEQQNQPGIVGELVEGLHNLEQKVEHLVHPDLPVINDDASALAAADAARAEGFASHHEVAELTHSDAAPSSSEPEQFSSPSSGAPDGGIIGVIDETKSVAGNVGLAAIGAASTIKGHLEAIKQHLSLRGFEVALVQDIHNELDAIERLL